MCVFLHHAVPFTCLLEEICYSRIHVFIQFNCKIDSEQFLMMIVLLYIQDGSFLVAEFFGIEWLVFDQGNS